MKDTFVEIDEIFEPGNWTKYSHFLMCSKQIKGGIGYTDWAHMCRMIGNIDKMMTVLQNLYVSYRQRPNIYRQDSIDSQKEKIVESVKQLNDLVFLAKLSYMSNP